MPSEKIDGMNLFLEMLKRNRSSPHLDRALKFAAPLNDHLGINHFWYYRISSSGAYSYLGTHEDWNEYCYEHSLTNAFPCLRHPKILGEGISLMRASPSDTKYKEVQKIAWDRFQINFNLNLYETFEDGIEAFGFGSRFNDHKADERLLNELPLLRSFVRAFKENHKKVFSLLEENQVDLVSQMGTEFYKRPMEYSLPLERGSFLSQLGYQFILELTPREKQLLKYLASGYPASYIKKQLFLSLRTVENYIATLKDKLNCSSKVDLIQKAQEIMCTGWLHSSK